MSSHAHRPNISLVGDAPGQEGRKWKEPLLQFRIVFWSWQKFRLRSRELWCVSSWQDHKLYIGRLWLFFVDGIWCTFTSTEPANHGHKQETKINLLSGKQSSIQHQSTTVASYQSNNHIFNLIFMYYHVIIWCPLCTCNFNAPGFAKVVMLRCIFKNQMKLLLILYEI